MGPIFLAALTSSILTLGGRELLASNRASDQRAPATAESPSNELGFELQEALARIEAKLSATDLAAPSVARMPVSGTPDPMEPRQIPEAEARLVEILARMERVLAINAPSLPMPSIDRGITVDYAGIRALDVLQRRDRHAAEREVHMLTISEAIARFGYPDRTGAAQGQSYDMYWWYGVTDSEGESNTILELYFTGGLVLSFHVSGWE